MYQLLGRQSNRLVFFSGCLISESCNLPSANSVGCNDEFAFIDGLVIHLLDAHGALRIATPICQLTAATIPPQITAGFEAHVAFAMDIFPEANFTALAAVP